MADDEGKQLLAAAKVLLKEAKTDFKTACPAFEKAAKAYEAAIDAKASPEELDFYRDEFDKSLEKVNDNMTPTQGVLNYVKKMRETGTTNAAEVGAMLKEVAPIRAKLLGFITQARDLGKKGLKARDAADNSAGELDADLSAAKDRVKDVLATIGDVAGTTKTIIAAARKAHADGKQQGFFAERQKLHPIAQRRKSLNSARDEVNAVKKKLPKDDRDRHTEVQYLLDDLTSRALDFDALDAEIKKLLAMPLIQKAAPPPPPKLNAAQVKKIGEIVGCDAKMNDKLGKALNDNPHGKWPAAIAKACGLKEADVKAKMASVNRLEFVKPLYLIDI